MKEVANHTRQLSRKKVPSIDISDIYELSKLEEATVSSACTEICQSDTPEESNTTILNENESPIKSNEIRKTVHVEVTTVNVSDTDKEKNIVLNNCAPSVNEESTPTQNNHEQEVSTEQTNLSDNPVPTTGVLDLQRAQKPDNKVAVPENNVIRSTTSEAGSKRRNTMRLEGEPSMKKTLLPYESILTHFKVPRWVFAL